MSEVTVVGGGLAGMVTALRLLERGYEVSLYESNTRLGGKAGANKNGGDYNDHGYHIFPAWYVNTWQLEEWTGRAKASGIAELKAFAVKLLQDTEAVVAAMTLPYSQGQTEGRINKLKLVKRSMYGRGHFDLLRQRVLYASAA
jgi:uncharacterized protein with NAD-binding domain and iron-sulfur cluster